jgi:hypothetical protein
MILLACVTVLLVFGINLRAQLKYLLRIIRMS